MTDDGRRRYFVPGFFGLWDTRAHLLELPKEHWEERVKVQHIENRTRIMEGLAHEYGPDQIEQKTQNFQDIGHSPLSIVSYHNLFFWQTRQAFIVGAYYPALTGATALGERILNHLILDLREHYKSHPSYKHVHRKESFDDWDQAISVLESWNILESNVGAAFQKLKRLRHKSLHFNAETYRQVRNDALEALNLVKQIIAGQFSAFGAQRWFIKGTRGACFIKKDFESDPFVRTFYVPQCPKVGYKYALNFLGPGVITFDQDDYGDGSLTDDEFCNLFNNRKSEEVVSSDIPPASGIITWLLVTGEASRVTLEKAASPEASSQQP